MKRLLLCLPHHLHRMSTPTRYHVYPQDYYERENGDFVLFEDYEKARKVKPLVWQERSPQCFMAETIAGAYWVDKVEEVWVGYLESEEKIDPMAPSFSTEDLAKAACNQHWTSLVLSLLES